MGQLKSRELLAELLSKPRGVQRHVEELSRLVESQGFDGIEIDYERVPPALWEPFTRFAEALAGELHRKGKRMNVALEPGALHRGKDQARILKYWPRLARCADALKFMCYYERGDYSKESGAGNSLAWVEDTARKALELVGPDKLWVALSLAGTDWVSASESSGVREVRRLHYGQVLKILSDSGAQVRWDPESASPYFRYVDSGERHEVWFEDERSLKAKVDALRAIGVKRVAIWYLGARHPDVRSLGLCPR